MKKLLLFIATEKGFAALKKLVDGAYANRVGCVITFKEVNVEKSWDIDIRNMCIANSIPCYLWGNVKDCLIEMVQKMKISGAVTIAWRYLIPLEINRYLEDDLIVFHDSLLPKYRGFAPTPTALMCGEKKIGITAFYATDEVDKGDVVLQKEMYVSDTMYMKDIIAEQTKLYGEMLETLIEQMENQTLQAFPQNEEEATYSIWRGPDDCHIDWSKSAKEIYDFVRAVGSPYTGAFTFLNGQKIKVLRTEIIPHDLDFTIRDTGKIWRIQNNEPEIICGIGMLRIKKAVTENGEQIVFNRIRCKLA